MIWLWAYLGIGALSLLVLLALSRRRRVDSSTSELLTAIRGPVSRKDWGLAKGVGPGLGRLLMVFGWPIAIYMVMNEERKHKQSLLPKEEAVFKVTKADLISPTNVAAVELAEMVPDPMGAVPSLPFGFLNKVWRDSVAIALSDAVLWTFETVWTDDWGQTYYRQGYVWVNDGKPGHWMLTVNERVENEK